MNPTTIRFTDDQTEWLESHDDPVATVVRGLVNDARKESTDSPTVPDTERQTMAYKRLLRRSIEKSSDGLLHINTEVAINNLAQGLRLNKSIIKTEVLPRLDRNGFITVEANVNKSEIYVKPAGVAPGPSWRKESSCEKCGGTGSLGDAPAFITLDKCPDCRDVTDEAES